MGGSDSLSMYPDAKCEFPLEFAEVGEGKAFVNKDYTQKSGPRTALNIWSRLKITLMAAALIGFLIIKATARILPTRPSPSSGLVFHGDSHALRSNGTHNFKRMLLMVSIDGFRADYLDRGFTPNLLEISKQGLRAKSMQPVFPTVTLPNQWTLMTGLYAESHGIVANDFWDPVTKTEFHYEEPDSSDLSHWWLGEPIWETAQRAGMLTANLMWSGPTYTTSGATPTYMEQRLEDKLDQILKWIDLPFDKRPQLITAYEPSLDDMGHAFGPFSSEVNSTLRCIDTFAKDLYTQLEARNLTDIVDIIFVSDHGMVDTGPTLIDLDKILGDDGVQAIEHMDGWPALGIRFRQGTNESLYLERLRKAAEEHPERLSVFIHETMPQRWHLTKNERVAPIYVVPKTGNILKTAKEPGMHLKKGSHGFDNIDTAMQALFVAHGPFSTAVKALHQSQQQSERGLSWENQGWHSTADDSYIMDTFPNVEIYNLVMNLFGIEDYAASNDGTPGFWNKYF